MNLTARKMRNKTFYVFFAFGSQYSGCYAVLNASSYDAAQTQAWMRFGYANVGRIEKDEQAAKGRVKCFLLNKIEGE